MGWHRLLHFLCVFGDEAAEQAGHRGHRHHVIDLDIAQSAEGHRSHFGVIGVLDNGGTAVLLDRPEACGAVVKAAGQDNPDHARAISQGCGPEQGVDGRPEAIFLGAIGYPYNTVREDEMFIRRRRIDVIEQNRLPISRGTGL